MKISQQFTLLVFVLIQSIGFSQTNNLEIISNKYNASLQEENKGIAVLVKKNNQINTISFGNFNLSENKVFNIGSATKTFTAILILQEVEKGNMSLNDSIGMYLTPIKIVSQSLTIENLLLHESGLDEVIVRNIETIFFAKNDSLYNAQLLDQVEKNNSEMLGKYDYCNTNYFLLGKIIEKVTDRSYFDLLRERIINPLKMTHSYPYVHKNIENLATPYHQDKDVTEYLDYRYFANIAYAAGSIASTLTDMEIFYTSLFETNILLKKETVEKMMDSGYNFYGLGLRKSTYNNVKYYGHGGNNIGYSFRNGYNPITKNLYLMFSNSQRIPSEKSIKNDVLAYLHDEKIETKLNEIDLDSFKNFIGNYLLKEANITLEIIEENSKMYLVGQGTKNLLVQKNENTLFETSHGVDLERVNGDINTLKFTQNGYKTTISRVNTTKK
ncbi:serine hydrolase domain-containing protein [Lutibacter citreus]|uniref:serine hydrolase domain-containing protein n=1 Tax=Lutibacter citreus TaxID=2138210 RepID=UPI000DBE3335|nr:serine hydrolase domain-containing protein [Lutibacter citreus]